MLAKNTVNVVSYVYYVTVCNYFNQYFGNDVMTSLMHMGCHDLYGLLVSSDFFY